ncbi:c-type cytochrome [Escherichia coli]
MRGDENALTAQQKKGYQLFKDNKCATCHGGIILGGRSFEPLGLKKTLTLVKLRRRILVV